MPVGAAWQEAVPALVRGDRRIYLQGLTPAGGAYVLARLFQKVRRPFLIITPNTSAHEIFYKDLAFFAPEEASGRDPWHRLLLFPAHEVLPFKELSFDTEVSCARVGAAYVAQTSREPWLLVAPAAALRQKLPPPGSLQEALAYAVAGENLERESFLQTILESGYERRPVVEER